MPAQNIIPHWDVAQVFRMIFHNDTPDVFADHFHLVSREQQQCYKTMHDGMKQDFLGHAVSLGKKRWVQWFLDNDWPVSGRDFSLIKALLCQQTIGKINDTQYIKEPLHLGDLMRMMTVVQWNFFCTTLKLENAGNLALAFKNWNVAPSTTAQMSYFSTALLQDVKKHESLKTHPQVIARLCRHHIYLLEDFDKLGWNIATITGYWGDPAAACVDRMLSDATTRKMVDKILSSSWFEKFMSQPSSITALSQKLDTSPGNENVWAQLVNCDEHPIDARKIVQRLLDLVSLENEQTLQLQANLTVHEQKYGLPPAGETLKAFLSKQIITASLKNSVKSEVLSEKKSFKKM